MRKKATVVTKKKATNSYSKEVVTYVKRAHKEGLSYRQILNIFEIAPGSLNYLIHRDVRTIRE